MSWSQRIWHESRTSVSPAALKALLLGDRHPRRLPVDELDAAGRAPRVAAAGVQDVHVGVLLDRQHQALVCGDLERPVSFDGELWHPDIV